MKVEQHYNSRGASSSTSGVVYGRDDTIPERAIRFSYRCLSSVQLWERGCIRLHCLSRYTCAPTRSRAPKRHGPPSDILGYKKIISRNLTSVYTRVQSR